MIFNKAPCCICGPNDDTIMPKGGFKLDYECELGVVIGQRARYLAKDKAMDAVAGYCISNDVSERAFQMEHGQTICKGKGGETFGPLGPWFVTKDEIRNPQKLAMCTTSTANAPARLDRHHGVRCGASGLVLLAVFRAGAGRRDRHRHAAGRGLRHEAGASSGSRPATWWRWGSRGWGCSGRRSCRSRLGLRASARASHQPVAPAVEPPSVAEILTVRSRRYRSGSARARPATARPIAGKTTSTKRP